MSSLSSSITGSSTKSLGGGNSGSGIETVSSSSFNLSSNAAGGGNPISSLENQYAFPLGQRLILGVQVNAACWECCMLFRRWCGNDFETMETTTTEFQLHYEL